MVLQTIRWLGLMLFRPCGNSDAKLYAWCQAGNKWDYCKVTTFPYPSRTVDSKSCRSGNSCGYNGDEYAWCYTDASNNLGYCCTTDCDSYRSDYDWCTTGTDFKWQFCHRDMKTTYRSSLGKTCKFDSLWGYHNEAYASCNTTDDNWDCCCTGDCASHGKHYDWCTSGTKWSYCKIETMPYPRHTYNLTPCRSDSTCGYHGKDYAWCHTDSSWDYCCTTERNMQEKNFHYDWCTTGISNKWQYCKRDKLPRRLITAPNNPCQRNHTCGYHGKAYAWCYTSSSWEYWCTGTCASYVAGYDWCTSGNKWSKCCCSLYD